MKSEKITRKKFLTNASMLGLTTFVGGTWLSACSSPSGQTEQNTEATAPTTPPADEPSAQANAEAAGSGSEACNDLTGLTEVEIQQREQLQYVAQSNKEDQICANCRFWQPAPEGAESVCGGCQLIKGPINPNGWCQTWAPQQT